MGEEMCLVERDGAAFYAPMDQAPAWDAQGYAVYAMMPVPLNRAADTGDGTCARGVSAMTRAPKEPKAEEIA